jgi:uncharacterized membrane protein
VGAVSRVVANANTTHRASLNLQDRIGLKVTHFVGTMYCAYVFALLAFVALPQAIASRSPMVLVAWASSNMIQLVLLPVILVGQNLEARHSDARAEMDYQFSRRFEQLTEEMLHTLTKNEKRQTAMMGRLEALTVRLSLLVGAEKDGEGSNESH